MKPRIKRMQKNHSEFFLLRKQLGIGKFQMGSKKYEEKKKILIELALKKIEEKEKDDFIVVGYRRRKVTVFPSV
jgi:hypothetical protein